MTAMPTFARLMLAGWALAVSTLLGYTHDGDCWATVLWLVWVVPTVAAGPSKDAG